jgi:hypothetical protein
MARLNISQKIGGPYSIQSARYKNVQLLADGNGLNISAIFG